MSEEKKVEKIVDEIGEVTITLKNGIKRKIPSKTIYTYYTDGTNDCRIEIAKPLDLFGENKLED